MLVPDEEPEKLEAAIVPETVKEVRVPTEVNEDETTLEARVVPVRVPAAAVTVMLAEPLKDTPLIVRGVWRVVAVPALPEISPEILEPARDVIHEGSA